VNPSWPPLAEQFLRRYLNRNDVFVDVGANIGTLSLTRFNYLRAGGGPHQSTLIRTYKLLGDNLNLNDAKSVIGE
jgi:hypothetical protein